MLDGLNTRRLIRLDELSVSKHKNGQYLLCHHEWPPRPPDLTPLHSFCWDTSNKAKLITETPSSVTLTSYESESFIHAL